jgi:hypothetical protein
LRIFEESIDECKNSDDIVNISEVDDPDDSKDKAGDEEDKD